MSKLSKLGIHCSLIFEAHEVTQGAYSQAHLPWVSYEDVARYIGPLQGTTKVTQATL